MIKVWHDMAWEDYLSWQALDKKVLKRINRLLQDIERNGYGGIGKPEPLKHDLSGFWSVKIDEKNRIVFRIENDKLEITTSVCGRHLPPYTSFTHNAATY